MTDPRPKPPSDLGNAGRRLWSSIIADLAEGMEFDARELAILAAAGRQADSIASLERAIRRDGTMVRGAAGQRRLNAAVTEVRQARVALARLLGELDLSDAASGSQTAASRRARKAADTRWAEHAARRAARG